MMNIDDEEELEETEEEEAAPDVTQGSEEVVSKIISFEDILSFQDPADADKTMGRSPDALLIRPKGGVTLLWFKRFFSHLNARLLLGNRGGVPFEVRVA